MDPQTARLIYRLSLGFALVCAIAVPVAYQWLSKGAWRKHPYGRHLMGSDTLLAVILGSIFVVAVGPWPTWVKWLILSAEMIVFGIFRIYRVRFMMHSQSTGYANTSTPSERTPS